jgi:hypothetical protein
MWPELSKRRLQVAFFLSLYGGFFHRGLEEAI